MNVRVGQGFDVHPWSDDPGRALVLGGVVLPGERGLAGHSDADVVVINKIDLLPHLDFDLPRFLANLADVNPKATVIQASSRTGDGVDAWCAWLLALAGR